MCTYFKNIKRFPYKDQIVKGDFILAHIKDKEGIVIKETLEEHSNLSCEYLEKIIEDKNIERILEILYKNITEDNSLEEEAYRFYKELIYGIVDMHDVGKINKNFQIKKMNNQSIHYINKDNADSNHSMASSIIYSNYFIKRIFEFNISSEDLMLKLIYIMFLNAYAISKHHGNLDDFSEYLVKFAGEYMEYFIENRDIYESYTEEISKYLTSSAFLKEILELYNEKCALEDRYIYGQLVFSLLTASDFYATHEFMNEEKVVLNNKINDVDKYFNAYKNKDFYKDMINHKNYLKTGENPVYKEGDINELRSELNIETEEVLLKNLYKNIFYLEAPTGSGKTITSLNLALNALKYGKNLEKLFYIFPFNTLIEQTKDVFINNLFENVSNVNNEVTVVNSLTPIKPAYMESKKYEAKEVNYEKSLLDRQFLHYPIVLTTNVSFFNYLFGTSREDAFPLLQLINSVVVLDEIQSYKSGIWKEIIIFLEKYAELFNIKVIIMSATLPRLDELVDEDGRCTYLVSDRDKYFLNPLFRDRVEINYELLSRKDISLAFLKNRILKEYKINKTVEGNTNKILVECLKKKSAIELYKMLQKEQENVYLITGDDNKYERRKIIQKVKDTDSCILVATQVIEAGVDIDMDIGFKDISILDAEEQFLGRINRSCKKKNCKAYFFNLDNIDKLYGLDYRNLKNRTLLDDKAREILKSKKFDIYYEEVLKDINEYKDSNMKGNIARFYSELSKLKYRNIEKHMRLIDREAITTLYLATQIEFDGEIIDGVDIWKKYKSILGNKKLSYAQRKIELSNLSELVDLFTYQVYEFPDTYDEQIGNLLYIEDGNKYMIEGKFDREKYSNEMKYGFSLI